MIRSKEEIKQIATNIVVFVLSEFPKVRDAVNKTKKEEWQELLDDLTVEIRERLLNQFGSSD